MRDQNAPIPAEVLSEALFRARQSERNRIARILHDSFLQQCQTILLALDTEPLHIDVVAREAREAMAAGRDLIVELRQPNTGAALGQRIDALGARLCERAGIRFDAALSAQLRARCDAFADGLYACLSEAIRNAVRHAHAGTIQVHDTWRAHQRVISVVDDGIGLPADVRHGALHGAESDRHFGLIGMREEAAALGGACYLARNGGSGTRVEFRFARDRWPATA